MKFIRVKPILMSIICTLVPLMSKASRGGSDGGGGQGYLGTDGQIYFADINPSLNPVAHPMNQNALREVIKSIPCTEKTMVPLEETKYAKVLAKVQQRTQAIAALPHTPVIFSKMAEMLRNRSYHVTAFPLPQLGDSESIPAVFQIQAAYFESGVVFFQLQVLNKMNEENLIALFVKEAIRDVNYSYELGLSNSALESATRLVVNDEIMGVFASEVNQALLVPQGAEKERAELDKQIAEVDEKIKLYKSDNNLVGLLHLKRSSLYMRKANTYNSTVGKVFGPKGMEDVKAELGYPRWLMESHFLQKGSEIGLTMLLHAYDTSTGKLVWNLGCD